MTQMEAIAFIALHIFSNTRELKIGEYPSLVDITQVNSTFRAHIG